VPAANQQWEPRFPAIFHVRDGYARTGDIGGPEAFTGIDVSANTTVVSLIPAFDSSEGATGQTFLEFFQTDKETGKPPLALL
jgi:hypothetical protein